MKPRKKASKAKGIAKGPLFITVALVFASPICLAEAAQAQVQPTSLKSLKQTQGVSFVRPQLLPATSTSFDSGRLAGLQLESGLTNLPQTLPRNYLSSRLFASSLPSLEDIYKLESTLSSAKEQLKVLKTRNISSERITELETLVSELEDAITASKQARTAYERAQGALSLILKDVQTKKEEAEALLTLKNTAQTTLTSKQLTLQEVQTIKDNAEDVLTTAEQTYTTALTEKQLADAALTSQKQIRDEALTNLLTKQEQNSAAASQLNQAQQSFNTAQSNYDNPNNRIPDPTWTHPTYQQERTRQVPVTTTTTTGGLTATTYDRRGYNNAPPMPSANETPLSTQTVTHVDFIWDYVLNSGRNEDVIVKFTGYIQVPTTDYYHFYTPADDGTRLYINNTLYIDDWYDKGGGGSTSQAVYLTAGQAVPITLYYYENGGGAAVSFQYYTYSAPYYQIVPAAWLGTQTTTTTTYVTETYYTTELVPGATAPLIKNPALLPAVTTAINNLSVAQANYSSTTAQVTEAEIQLAIENQEVERLTQESVTAQSNLDSAQASKESASTSLATATSNLEASLLEVAEAEADLTEVSTKHQAASVELAKAQTQSEELTKQTNTSLEVATKSYTEASQKASTTSNEVANTKPEPEPEKLPEVITSETLLATDLSKVDPTQMTEEQAEELKEAALEVFLTADEGSPEYEQALDALYLAAEQDDIQLSPELAAIPGLAAATELVNFFGNAGSDMSPKTREESEKVVVTAVVAAGAAIQSAAAAAATASGGTTRRIGN